MEGLRGFAVLLVFFVHYASLIEPWIASHSVALVLAHALLAVGDTGVDLFFVLSGFLIYGSLLSRPQPFGHFLYRRAERIYPAFTAVFLIYIALSIAFPSENKIPSPATDGAIYLLQNYLLLPGLLPIEPMITVAWSLSYEMFYYLAVPLLIGLFKLRDRSPSWRTTFFIGMTLALVIYSAMFGGPIKLIMFLAGILLYEALNHSSLHVSSTTGSIALVVGLTAMLLPLPGTAGRALQLSIVFIAFFLLCLSCFRTPSGWLPNAFAWTPLRWLGNMSYSYYLLHGLALKAAFMALAMAWPATGDDLALSISMLPLLFAFTLLPSAMLFLLVERPCSLAPHSTHGAARLRQAASASESGS